MSSLRNHHIIFIHGYTASSRADWYPALSKLLDSEGVSYSIPDLPGGDKPHANEWLEVLHETIASIDKPLILVGHSLGTRTALLYLERYRPQAELVLLVAAFNNRTDNANRHDGETYPDFFTHQIDIESIKPLVKQFIVAHSKDDQDLSFAQGERIAADLDAQLMTFENRDHFCEPENATIIFNILKESVV